VRVTLTKQQALVANAASKSNPHPELCVAAIGKGYITAVDGFMLARAPVEYDGEYIFVPATSLPRSECDVALEDDSLTVVTKDGTAEEAHAPLAKYPATPEFWNKQTKRKPKACVALDVAMLRKMLSCIKSRDGGNDRCGIVRLFVRKSSDPVEWRVEDGDDTVVEGLVMPMFVNWRENV